MSAAISSSSNFYVLFCIYCNNHFIYLCHSHGLLTAEFEIIFSKSCIDLSCKKCSSENWYEMLCHNEIIYQTKSLQIRRDTAFVICPVNWKSKSEMVQVNCSI